MLIPSGFFNQYYSVIDETIDNEAIGERCTIYYPSVRTICPNCIPNTINFNSTNTYRSGGPIPFTFGTCPLCQGVGFTQTESSENIRLKVYFTPKTWIKVGNFQYEDGKAQIMGYMRDSTKVLRAERIVLFSENTEFGYRDYKLQGPTYPYGFGHRYFIAYIHV